MATADPFAAAVGSIFANKHISLTAVYTPSGGLAVSVLVIKRYEDESVNLLTTGARQSALVFDVQVAAVPTRPANGDILKVEGITYRIRRAEPDRLGLVWQLDVEPT